MRQEPKNKNHRTIFVYGFEAAGFTVPEGHTVNLNNAVIRFVSLNSPIILDKAEGIIIPSGIFESFKDVSDYSGDYVNVYCKTDLLLQREREILNLFRAGGWICCLVKKIIDEVPSGYRTKDCHDTDLSKRLMNGFSIEREAFKGSAYVTSKNDAFNDYIKRWGVAKTILSLSYKDQDRKILAKVGDSVVGVEFGGKIFFLPFHSTKSEVTEAESVVKELCGAINDYLQKRRIEIPDWANAFVFAEEEKLQKELGELLSKADQLQQTLFKLKSYKGILTQSGEALKDTVVLILRDFFSLNVTDVEEFKEDALIRDQEGKPLIVLEIKGTKSGVKREYINQVDSHRERRGLNSSLPGLLIINDQMDVEEISERLATTVASEQIVHAQKMNVLILKTIDLLFLMRFLESNSEAGKVLLDHCTKGGGRLIINDSEIKTEQV